ALLPSAWLKARRGSSRGQRVGNRGLRARRRGGTKAGEESVRVTENEQRAADSLRASDLVLRGVGVVGLIAVALVLLLVLYPT
ncbi:MAG TPA: hypothetical protein VFY70_11340, partial [Thermomicrobiales bacterium]|nr:hypothetical protein [Thermomicrobiales bacterium]